VDSNTACHVVRQLDRMAVAMAMLEDQARPRRCGHADGKLILALDAYIGKLNAVLDAREDMLVLARTDASGDDIFRRVDAISATSADALMVDGISSLECWSKCATARTSLFSSIRCAGGRVPASPSHSCAMQGSTWCSTRRLCSLPRRQRWLRLSMTCS